MSPATLLSSSTFLIFSFLPPLPTRSHSPTASPAPTHPRRQPISPISPPIPPTNPSRRSNLLLFCRSDQSEPSPKSLIHASDPRLRLTPTPNPLSQCSPSTDKLGFSGFRGFYSLIQALGFIIEAAAAFLHPLL